MLVKPKHQQLFDLLKSDFQKGKWPLGHKLPSVKELALQYSVSVNVASKAVEMLKEAKHVRAKKGDGIYSIYAGNDLVKDRRYAGERLYGQYRGAKRLTVFIEDTAPWHIEFWSHTLELFAKHFNDIELDVAFNGYHEETQHPDIAIGGRRYLAELQPRMRQCLSIEPWMGFSAKEYARTLVPDTDLTTGRFTIGFNTIQLLARQDAPAPRPDETGVQYASRLAKGNKGGYLVLSMHDFLLPLGCPFHKLGQEDFSADDRQAIIRQLDSIKPLYDSGALLWYHGQLCSPAEKAELLTGGQAAVVECTSNLHRQFPAELKCKVMRRPDGGHPLLYPIFAQVNGRTLFPEECLRLVKWLLTVEVQKQAAQHHVFFPLLTELLKKHHGPLLPLLQSPHCHWQEIQSESHYKVRELFIGWELLSFLKGVRTSQETIDLLNHKIRHYYKNRLAAFDATRPFIQGVPQ